MFGANEYALNVLPPRFLVHARNILEGLTLARLRSRRVQVARNIVAQLSPMFEELGVRLESVTIGAVDDFLDESLCSLFTCISEQHGDHFVVQITDDIGLALVDTKDVKQAVDRVVFAGLLGAETRQRN